MVAIEEKKRTKKINYQAGFFFFFFHIKTYIKICFEKKNIQNHFLPLLETYIF